MAALLRFARIFKEPIKNGTGRDDVSPERGMGGRVFLF